LEILEMLQRSETASASFEVTTGPASEFISQRGALLIVLLCGGDKSSQAKDIVAAKALAAQLEE
jgi:putative component of toxin-antitoxin plasmid stabilization module